MYMGLYLNFYLYLHLHLYVLHSSCEGKIHYSHLTLFIPSLEIDKLWLTEDISNITRREIQILKYSFYYTLLLFHLLVNGMILNTQEQCVGVFALFYLFLNWNIIAL